MMAARAGKPEGREQEQHGHEMADYGRGGILRGRVGSGDVQSDLQGVLLPSGTLKAFAEYIPAYGKGAVPGPEGTEPVRLEQAIDATRAAKDARALKEAAAALDAYWQSRLDALYAPVAAWLASWWFVKSELIEHQSKWFKEMPLQELQDE